MNAQRSYYERIKDTAVHTCRLDLTATSSLVLVCQQILEAVQFRDFSVVGRKLSDYSLDGKEQKMSSTKEIT